MGIVNPAAGGGGGGGGSASSGVSGVVQTSDGAGGFANIGTLAAALAALGWYEPVTVTLTAADLIALDDGTTQTEFVLVADPGAGKILRPSKMTAFIKLNGGVAPNVSGPNLYPYYEGGHGASEYATAIATSFDLLFRTAYFQGADCVTAVPLDMAAASIASRPALPLGGESITGFLGELCLQATGGPLGVPGGIDASVVNDGGTGYAVNDQFTVDDVNNTRGDNAMGTPATGTVTAESGGVVTAYTISPKGNFYLVGTGITTTATSGGGSGLLIDVSALDYSTNGIELTVVTHKEVVDVP